MSYPHPEGLRVNLHQILRSPTDEEVDATVRENAPSRPFRADVVTMISPKIGAPASCPPVLFHLGGSYAAGIDVMESLFVKLDPRP